MLPKNYIWLIPIASEAKLERNPYYHEIYSWVLSTYCPSLKYSFRVFENRLENLTNSLFRCSRACFPLDPGMKAATSFTASRSFLIAEAISLQKEKCRVIDKNYNKHSIHHHKKINKAYLIVSKKVFRSVISSGIRLRIFFNAADFLLSSWKASSERLSLYSTTKIEMKI